MSQPNEQESAVQGPEGVEEILHVPEDMVNFPLGFAVDAGGSMTKVVYRSKKDYASAKPLHDKQSGVLRLRNFNMNQAGDVIGFLKENCDVINVPDDDEEWWMTGVTTQHFKKELDATFNVKTKLMNEMTAIQVYMKHFDRMKFGCYDVDTQALVYSKFIVSIFAEVFRASTEKEDKESVAEMKEQFDLPPIPLDCPSLKLMAAPDVEPWAREYLSFSGKMEFPSLLVHLGSAGPIILITNDGCKFVDFLYGIGKIISGLTEELTGESDFAKIMKMAERGKLENVDLTTDDIKNLEHKEDDVYNVVDVNMTIFELGKLSSSNFRGKGTYNKDDLAVGVLSSVLKLASKTIFLQAKMCNVKSILISGSLSKYKLARHHLQRALFVESIFNNMKGGDLMKVHFLKNPGFLCSFGVWLENMEKHKKKKQTDSGKVDTTNL